MKVTPRYLVQLSSAEMHALVQRKMRSFVAERPEGRGMEPAVAPSELVSLDRWLLARLKEVTDNEEAYFEGRRLRPEAAWINEEHAVLAEVAAKCEVISAGCRERIMTPDKAAEPPQRASSPRSPRSGARDQTASRPSAQNRRPTGRGQAEQIAWTR